MNIYAERFHALVFVDEENLLTSSGTERFAVYMNKKGEGGKMKNENRIPDIFETDAEYREWMEKRQLTIRQETIDGFKQSRKSQGMTQSELGKKAGISQPNITRFESGSYNPSLDFMVKIAAAMGKRVQITLVDE